jgi:hypothetical protein
MVNEIRLDQAEISHGAWVGMRRQIGNMGRPDTYGLRSPGWVENIEGSLGELAAAKYFNRYWNALVIDFKSLPGDIGREQIRTRTRRPFDLLLHKQDSDIAPYIVVGLLGQGKRDRVYRMVGWMYGKDGKRAEWWRELQPGRPCYVVPAEELRPISELVLS